MTFIKNICMCAERVKSWVTRRSTLMQHAATVVQVPFKLHFNAHYNQCWDERACLSVLIFTVKHISTIITSTPSAVNRANLYWRFSLARALMCCIWLPLSETEHSHLTTQFCNCQNKARVEFPVSSAHSKLS